MTEKKTYTYEEVYKASLEYFNGNELAANVFVSKYALKDKNDNYYELTPADMHDRLAKEFARVDSEYYNLDYAKQFNLYRSSMDKFARICPQGSPMSAIGNPYQLMSASNCVVIASPTDDIEGIFQTAEELAQLYKRRCVAKGSKVVTKEKGVINIEDVTSGMHILSFDINTKRSIYNKVLNKFISKVKKEDRISIRYSNGTELKTSKKHPVLELTENGFTYTNAGKIKIGSVNIKPNLLDLSELNIETWTEEHKNQHDFAWFMGAHLGDGSANYVKVGRRNNKHNRIRFRILGDNEDVVKNYCRIHNNLTGNSSNYFISPRKDYKVTCWEFSSSVKSNNFLAELLNNQIGSKTYSAFIPDCIDSDFKMWSFIAGLIDTDGTIKAKGQQIVISICAKETLDKIAVFLQSKNISTHFSTRTNIRPNEHVIYKLSIHYNEDLWKGIAARLSHNKKKEFLLNYNCKNFSLRKPLMQNEYNLVLEKYNKLIKNWDNKEHRLLCANIYHTNEKLKHSKQLGAGKAFLNQLIDFNIFDKNHVNDILNRVSVIEIVPDIHSEIYYDIEVENTNNFYCGNNGLVVIHNCGVGIDISTLRPDGMTVNNASKTTTGAWSFADLYSYVTRMIGQCVAKGERVLTKNGLKAIENVKPNIDEVWTKKGWIKVKNVLCNGQKSIFEVKTVEGFTIKTSIDHVFAVEKDGDIVEQKLSDIKVGDCLILLPGTTQTKTGYIQLKEFEYTKKGHNNSNRLNTNVIFPTKLEEKLAYLLGFMYGDGSVQYDKFEEPLILSVACEHKRPKIQDKFVQFSKEIFNITPTSFQGDGAVNKVSIGSKLIVGWLQINNLLKEKAYEIVIPKKIFNSPASVQSAFLAGFFDADGYNSGKKKGYVFSTVNYKFAKDMQTLLMSHGIISKLFAENRDDKGWRTLYTVSVTGRHAQERFVETIGAFSVKAQENKFIAKRDNYLTPYKAATLKINYNHYDFIPDNSQYISANAYLQLPYEKQTTELLLKSKVVDIKVAGVSETYDLVLEDEHLFWCEGFYIHNSGRRGALMITLDVHHPDVLKFTTMKHDLTKVTGANVSLKLSNEFLSAVEKDTDYELRWPCDSDNPKIKQKIKARDVWNTIIDSATKTAEPGLLLWNNITDNLPAHCYPEFKCVSTNPCSEIPLSAYDSCRLISINLTGYVKNPFDANAYFDFDLFKQDITTATQMADNLVDLELELIDKIKSVCSSDREISLWDKLYNTGKTGRRTGLGTHGLADTLAQLCIKYDSNEALDVVEKIYTTLRDTSYITSSKLAKERGAFPVFDWEKEKECAFIKRLPSDLTDHIKQYGRRNISILTQAPTGSVSLLSKVGSFDTYNVSSGVEPVFRNSYIRRKKINPNDFGTRVDYVDVVGDKWQEFKVYHSNVQNYLNKFNSSDEQLPSYFVTSDQINWEKRVDLQAVEQLKVDHAISSTINLSKGTSNDTVSKIYLDAWKKGLKGVTVYVDGSRDGVLVSSEEKETKPETTDKRFAPPRSKTLQSETHKIKIDSGDGELKNAYITVSFFEDTKDPYEVFINAPTGNDAKDAQILELTSRMTSLALRHGVPVEFITNQLSKVDGQYIYSIPTSLAKILMGYIETDDNKEQVLKLPKEKQEENVLVEKDPKTCKHENKVYSEGCFRCLDCSFSGCG